MLGKLKDAATRCVLRPVRQNAFAVPGSAAPPDPLDGFGEGDRKEGNGKDGKGMEGGRRGNEKGWGNGINGSLRLFFYYHCLIVLCEFLCVCVCIFCPASCVIINDDD